MPSDKQPPHPTPRERYEEYRERFRALPDSQLIDAFNREVGNNGWTSARGSYLAALHDAFRDRGFDYSAVGDEQRLSFRSKVVLNGKVLEPLDPTTGSGAGPAMLRVPDL